MTTENKHRMEFGTVVLVLIVLFGLVSWYRQANQRTIQNPDPVLRIEQPTVVLPETAIPVSPDDVPKDGFFGYEPDAAASEEFRRANNIKGLREESPELFDGGWGDAPVVLTRFLEVAYLDKFGKPWVVGRQGIGDCVGWGHAHCASIELAVQAVQKGSSGDFWPVSPEACYGVGRVEGRGKEDNGSRPVGGWSDGSYGGPTTKGMKDFGLLFSKDYTKTLGFDLTNYSSERAKQWGAFGMGGKGDAGKAEHEGSSHRVGGIALVTTLEELDAALRSGYPVSVCSGRGFASSRDSEGFAAARGSWAHCMALVGSRTDVKGYLILNSWGPNWISGPKAHGQPEGSFWAKPDAVLGMLRQKDSYAISGTVGFPPRKIDWSKGWGKIKRQPLPKEYALAL